MSQPPTWGSDSPSPKPDAGAGCSQAPAPVPGWGPPPGGTPRPPRQPQTRRPWYRRKRFLIPLAILGVLVTLTIIGIVAGPPPPTSQTAGSTATSATASPTTAPQTTPTTIPASTLAPTTTTPPTTTAPATSTAATKLAPAAQRLTGFGATDADWNATHTPDSRFDPGSVYNNGTYFSVIHEQGRVLEYSMRFSPGIPISIARTVVMREFPTDATARWFAVKDTCAQLEVKSRTLGRALAAPTIGAPDGAVIIEFDTVQSNGEAVYNSRAITEAILMLGSYASPSDAPGC
jgi:hypothetical protein